MSFWVHNATFATNKWQFFNGEEYLMNYNYSEVSAPATSAMQFEFTSTGDNGTFANVVEYKEVPGTPGLYNLGFGHLKEDGTIDDIVRTNNGDTDKILATVASTAMQFTDKYPNATLFVIGSCPIRTRLYKRGISNNFQTIAASFIVIGLNSDSNNWELFNKNNNYTCFTVQRLRIN